jgi:hypothetical protein
MGLQTYPITVFYNVKHILKFMFDIPRNCTSECCSNERIVKFHIELSFMRFELFRQNVQVKLAI